MPDLHEKELASAEHVYPVHAQRAVVSGGMDTAGSFAVANLIGRPVQTVDMRVDFLRLGSIAGSFFLSTIDHELGSSMITNVDRNRLSGV
jgi:hypothetical protein